MTATGVPIFICGYQKSGTSVLAALLDGHPNLCVFPEETSILRWMSRSTYPSKEEALAFLFERTHVERLGRGLEVHAMEGDRDYRNFDFTRFHRLVTKRFMESNGEVRSLLDSVISAFAETSGQTDRAFWVEKTPRTEYFLETALAWYPSARALYIARDPRDAFASYRENRRANGADLSIGEFVQTWALSRWFWLGDGPADDSRLSVRFEDLLIRPYSTMRLISEWLGIEFRDEMLTPSKLGAPWGGNSMFGDRFSDVSPEPIGRWQQVLTPAEVRAIEGLLGREMTALGYKFSLGGVPFSKAARAWWGCKPRRKPVAGALLRLYWPFRLPRALEKKDSGGVR